MCDVAYVLLVEQVERLTLTEWQAAAFRGAEDLPQLRAVLGEQRAHLDEALAAEAVTQVPVEDDQQMRLRKALGVA